MEKVQSYGANIFFILFPLFCGTYFGYLFWNDINQNLQQNKQQPIGAIAQVAKSVQRQYASRNLWESANEGLALYSGDKIITGSGAAVRIAIATGDVIELGPDSLIALSFTKDGNGVITLESGTLVSVVSTGRLLMQSGDGPAKPVESESVYGSMGETAVASPFDELLSSTAMTPLIVLTELPVEEPLSVVKAPVEEPLPVVKAPVEVIEAPAPVRLRLPVPANLLPFQNSVISKRELVGFQGMRFSWDPVPEADSYIWMLGTINGVVLRRAVVNSPSYLATDVSLFTTNQDFVWTVQAQRAAPYNDEDTMSPAAGSAFHVYIPARLGAPANLLPVNNSVISKTELASLQGVRFSWSAVPEADSYIWTLGKSNGAVLHRASVRSTSYFLTDVSLFTMNQDFVWTVQAQRAAPYNDEDTISPAAESAFHVYIPARLGAPANLLPVNNSVISKTELASLQGVRFSWSAVPEADSYIWTLKTINGAVLRRAIVNSPLYHLATDVSLFTMNHDLVWTVQAQRAAPYNDEDTISPAAENVLYIYLPRIEAPVPREPFQLGGNDAGK